METDRTSETETEKATLGHTRKMTVAAVLFNRAEQEGRIVFDIGLLGESFEGSDAKMFDVIKNISSQRIRLRLFSYAVVRGGNKGRELFEFHLIDPAVAALVKKFHRIFGVAFGQHAKAHSLQQLNNLRIIQLQFFNSFRVTAMNRRII